MPAPGLHSLVLQLLLATCLSLGLVRAEHSESEERPGRTVHVDSTLMGDGGGGVVDHGNHPKSTDSAHLFHDASTREHAGFEDVAATVPPESIKPDRTNFPQSKIRHFVVSCQPPLAKCVQTRACLSTGR
eukprot:4133844-Pleurochrysis_carterae.AAC.2